MSVMLESEIQQDRSMALLLADEAKIRQTAIFDPWEYWDNFIGTFYIRFQCCPKKV